MLTPKQRKLLSFIERHIQDNEGVSPSFQEMAEAVGVQSKSNIHRLVCALEERGFIRRLAKRNRSIEIAKTYNHTVAPTQAALPAISCPHCGEPIAISIVAGAGS